MREILDAVNAGQIFRWEDKGYCYLEQSKGDVFRKLRKANYNVRLVQHEDTANCTLIVFPNSTGRIQIWKNQG